MIDTVNNKIVSIENKIDAVNMKLDAIMQILILSIRANNTNIANVERLVPVPTDEEKKVDNHIVLNHHDLKQIVIKQRKASPYDQFVGNHFDDFKTHMSNETNEIFDNKEVFKMIGRTWRSMTVAQKTPYINITPTTN